LDDDLLRQVLQLGRMPRELKDSQTDAEHAEKKLKMNLRNRGLVERAQRELLAKVAPYLRQRLRKKTSARGTAAELRHQLPHDRSSQDAPVDDGSGLRTFASTQRGSKRKRDGTEQSSGDVHPTAFTSADQTTFSVAEASNVDASRTTAPPNTETREPPTAREADDDFEISAECQEWQDREHVAILIESGNLATPLGRASNAVKALTASSSHALARLEDDSQARVTREVAVAKKKP
jgi:hypothetical protein